MQHILLTPAVLKKWSTKSFMVLGIVAVSVMKYEPGYHICLIPASPLGIEDCWIEATLWTLDNAAPEILEGRSVL
tara:strand:- start:95 stop:319 length:225 start_codon:yes stop_codon:yes gene_type:complete